MKHCLFILLLLHLVLLAGCAETLPNYTLEVPATEPTIESTTGNLPSETTRLKEWREYATYPIERPKDNVVNNVMYYTNARAVSYYDTDLRRTVYLCSQPNCTHSDSKCYAFLGGRWSSYTVVGDLVYALIDNLDEDNSIRVVERNLITGKTRLLWDLSPEENIGNELFFFSICGDEAFITFRQSERNYVYEGNYSHVEEKNAKQLSYSIDLITGDRTLLLEAEIPSVAGYIFSGSAIIPQACTGEFLLIHEVAYAEEPSISEEDYYKQNPDGNYDTYLSEVIGGKLKGGIYSLNRKTGEKTLLSEGGYVDEVNCIRDRQVAFVKVNTVYIYNGYTGEVSPCFEQDRIGFMTYLDGRIIFNIYPEDGSDTEIWEYFWYDLTTGEMQQFQEEIDGMVFTLYGETADYFYGYYNGRGNCFISKQDFYNENYDAAF